MKIQEVMMKQLGSLTWEQVTEEYPITSSYKALSEYFIAFKDWVSITSLKFIRLVFSILKDQVLVTSVVVSHRNHVVARSLEKSKTYMIFQLPFLLILKEHEKRRIGA